MTRRLLPLLAALLVAIPASAQKHEALKPKRAATWTAEPVHVTVPTTQPVAGEVDPDVLRGLATMQILAAWIPDVGVPQVVALPQGAAIRRSVEGQVLYEASSATKLPMRGLAGEGEVTLRLWSWYRPGWKHAEFWVEVANDSPWHPCGGLEANGTWRFVLDTPGGHAIPHAVEPYMLTPWWSPTQPSWVQVDFPRCEIPDGNFRGAGVVVGWGPHAMEEAYRAASVPDHGAQAGVFGSLWDVDEARGAQAAAIWARERSAWLAKTETNPYSNFPSVTLDPQRKHRLNHGQGGDDPWLFGQLVIPGLQEGGSNLAADYAILQVLAVEGRRPTWLDETEMEAAGRGYFTFSPRPDGYYQYYRIHRTCTEAWARGGWTDNEFGVIGILNSQGKLDPWTGPQHEHGYNQAIYQLAGLTLHPVIRDKALQHAARAAACCGMIPFDQGGYFSGGPKQDYLRELCRQHSSAAMGWHIATRWGMTDRAAQFDDYLSRKWEMMVTDPKGWRNNTGNTGDPIPWANTPLSHNPNGQLSLEDIAGTEFDREPFRSHLNWVNTKALWQTNQLDPQVLWAIDTQNRFALIGLRDLAFQLVWSALGPIENPTDLSDPAKVRMPKFAHPRVLGLGHKWQQPGGIPPAGNSDVIEKWMYSTFCWAAVFDQRGIDGGRREAGRAALTVFHPEFAWQQWGSAPPARWVEYANAHGGIPELGPVPVHTSVVAPR